MTEPEIAKSTSDSAVQSMGDKPADKKTDGKEAGDAQQQKDTVAVESKENAVADEKGDAASKPEVDEKKKDEQDRKPHSGYKRRNGRFYSNGYRYRRPYNARYRSVRDESQTEEQPEKPVVMQGVSGKVKWYSFRKNYGFIQRDDDEKDVFVHQASIAKSRIRKPHLRSLFNGELVQFDVVQGKRGLEAINVTGPNGTEVEGCRIIFVFNDFPDRRPFFDRYPPYYNNYGNRLPFYNNYDRRPYHRDQNGQRDGYEPARYPIRPYQGERDKFVRRRPYGRPLNRAFRRSSRATDQPKEGNVETAGADETKKNDENAKAKKNYRRGGRQWKQRGRDKATGTSSQTTLKEGTAPADKQPDNKEPVKDAAADVKNAGVIEVKN